MGTGKFAAMMAGGGLLIISTFSYAGDRVRVESLDSTQSVISSADAPGIGSDPSPLFRPDARSSTPALPRGDAAARTTTPFAAPFPPNQLTPPPVLPFNPNRSLMPAPAAPSHPPNPAR